MSKTEEKTALSHCASVQLPPTVPLPPAGELVITDVTHSSMKLTWDAAPGNVKKYIITYKPEEGDLKEVALTKHQLRQNRNMATKCLC